MTVTRVRKPEDDDLRPPDQAPAGSERIKQSQPEVPELEDEEGLELASVGAWEQFGQRRQNDGFVGAGRNADGPGVDGGPEGLDDGLDAGIGGPAGRGRERWQQRAAREAAQAYSDLLGGGADVRQNGDFGILPPRGRQAYSDSVEHTAELNRARSRGRHAAILERAQQGVMRGDDVTLGVGQEVFGNTLYTRFPQNPRDGTHHGTNAAYVLLYFAGDERGREAALAGLEQEVKEGENNSALQVLKDLSLLEAVRDLRTARTDEEVQEALKALAALELGSNSKEITNFLEKFPSATEAQTDREQELTPSEIVESRARSLEQARTYAREERMAQTIQTSEDVITAATGNPDERDEALGRLERAAQAELRSGQFGPAKLAFDNLSVLDNASAILQTASPTAAANVLSRLIEQAASGNGAAGRALQGLDTREMVRRLRDEDGATAREALKELKEAFKPQAERIESYKTKTPTDILEEFQNKEQVAKARESMREFADQSFKRADEALAVLVDRNSTPEQRHEALAKLEAERETRLRVFRNDAYSDVVNTSRAAVSVDDVRTACKAAYKCLKAEGSSEQDKGRAIDALQTALSNLQTLAKGDGKNAANQRAADFLARLGDDKAVARLEDALTGKDAEAIRAIEDIAVGLPSGNQAFNDLRLGRMLRELKESSKPEDYDKVIAQLAKENEYTGEESNSEAGEWLQWAQAGKQTARLSQATSPDEIRDASRTLLQMAAEDKNPYAVSALSGALAIDTGSNGVIGLYRDSDRTVKGKPGFIPSPNEYLRSDPAGKAAWQEVKLDIASHIAARVEAGASLQRGDAAALALAYAHERKDGNDTPLSDVLHKALSRAVQDNADGRSMRGVYDIIAGGEPGSENLADIYMGGRRHAEFETRFSDIENLAASGNVGALRVLSATASGAVESRELQNRAVKTLEGNAAVPELRARTLAAMVHANGVYGDKERLLQTMGKVASEFKSAAEVPQSVRDALHNGIASQADATHASAARGLSSMAALWTERDAKAIFDHTSKHTARGLRENGSKIPENLRTKLIGDLATRANPDSAGAPAAQIATLQSLSALTPYMTSEQLTNVAAYGHDAGLQRLQAAGASKEDAEKLQEEAGRVLLSALVKGSQQLKQDAFKAFETSRFVGITDEMRDVFTKMAKDQPYDLELFEKVNKLVYDTGLPRPIAGIFKNWDVPVDSNNELFEKASLAVKNLDGMAPPLNGEALVRRVAENIELFNSMPPEYRMKLFPGQENNADIQALVSGRLDPKKIVGQMVYGTFNESSSAFLLRDLNAEVSRLKSTAAGAAWDSGHKLDALLAERKAKFDRLIAHTSQDVPLLEKGLYALKVTTPVLNFVSSYDPYQKFEEKQSDLLARFQGSGVDIKVHEDAKRNAQTDANVYEFAGDIAEYTRLKNSGRQHEADVMLVADLLRNNEQYLQRFAPSVYGDLLPRDGTQLGRGAMGRLQDSKEAYFSELPPLSIGTPDSRMEGLAALASIPKDAYFRDIPAVRALAMASIDSSAGISKVGSVSRDMGDKLNTLNDLVRAASSGRKYDELVKDAQTRAIELKRIFADFKPEDCAQLDMDIKAIDAALKVEGAGRIQNEGVRQELQEKLKNLQQMQNLLDPAFSGRQEMDKLLDFVSSPNFKADTFINFLKTSGPLIAATVAAAALTVVACASFGVTSPLAIAAWCSVAGIAASELTTYGLYHYNEKHGYTGFGVYGEKAKFQKWYDDTSAENRTVANFLWEVGAKQYGAQFAFDMGMALTTMGLIKFLPNPSMMANKAAWMSMIRTEGQTMQQMAFNAQKAAARAEGKSIAAVYVKDRLKNLSKEVLNGLGFSAAQIGAETAIHDMSPESFQKWMEDSNSFVSFTLGTAMAAGHAGVAIRAGAGRVTHFDAPSLQGETAFINHFKNEGFRVQKVSNGTYHAWSPEMPLSSKPFVLQRGTGKPPATVFPEGYKPSQHTSAPNLETSVAGRDGHTWQQTPAEGKLLSEITAFSDHFRNQRFEDALRVSESAQGPAHTKNGKLLEATPESLATPEGLTRFLSDMGDVASVTRDTAGGVNRVVVDVPAPYIEIAPGVKADFRTGLTPQGTKLSAEHQTLFDNFRKGESGQRIMAEMALINMEEAIHINQYHGDGHILSPSFARFASEAAPGGALDSAFRGRFNQEHAATAGRAKFTYEQEAIMALHDSDPKFWTADMLDRHFGGQHKEIRKPVIEWLRARENGGEEPVASNRPRTSAGSVESLPERPGEDGGGSHLGRNPQFEGVISKIEAHATENFISIDSFPAGVEIKTADRVQQAIYKQLNNLINAREGGGQSLADQGWQVYQAQKLSAADRAHIDYAIVNQKTGQYIIVDATLNPSKEVKSKIRSNSVIHAQDGHYDPADGQLTQSGREMVTQRFGEIMTEGSPLNLQDHPPPSFKKATDAEALPEVDAYNKKLESSADADVRVFGKEVYQSNYYLMKVKEESTPEAQRMLGSFKKKADSALDKAIREYYEGSLGGAAAAREDANRNFRVEKGKLLMQTEGQRYEWQPNDAQVQATSEQVFKEMYANAKTQREKDALFQLKRNFPGNDALMQHVANRLRRQTNDQLFGREVVENKNKSEAKALDSLLQVNREWAVTPEGNSHNPDVEFILKLNVDAQQAQQGKPGGSKRALDEAQRLYDEYRNGRQETIDKVHKTLRDGQDQNSTRLGRNEDDADDGGDSVGRGHGSAGEGSDTPVVKPSRELSAEDLKRSRISMAKTLVKEHGWPKEAAQAYAKSLDGQQLMAGLEGLTNEAGPGTVFFGTDGPFDASRFGSLDEVSNAATALRMHAQYDNGYVNVVDGVPGGATYSRMGQGDNAFYEQSYGLDRQRLSDATKVYTVPKGTFEEILNAHCQDDIVTLTDPDTGYEFPSIRPGREAAVGRKIVAELQRREIRPVEMDNH